jgi:hypothetical protein
MPTGPPSGGSKEKVTKNDFARPDNNKTVQVKSAKQYKK